MGRITSEKFISFRKTVSIEKYEELLIRENVWFVTLLDTGYPPLLKSSHNPPFVLYGKGNKELLLDDHALGVVGTRKITSYGRQVTEMITHRVVESGLTIVSGLAMGVDAVAHSTAVQQNGRTIAVLGCGVDCCNPRSNQRLYEDIVSTGSCVISEFPLSQNPTIGSFPSRNRIIAGLSQGIVVTEGAEDSGALITAEFAFKDKRKVFAVPGPITSSLSKGPLKLLLKGAKLIITGEEILSELGVTREEVHGNNRDMKSDSPEEQMIIDMLKEEELSFDFIIQKTHLDTSRLNMLLSMMEMKGFVVKTEQGNYMLK